MIQNTPAVLPAEKKAKSLFISFLTACCLFSGVFSLSACSVSIAAENPPQSSVSPAQAENAASGTEPVLETAPTAESDTVVYQNTQYGFDFSLPESWRGYTVVTEQWEGYKIGDASVIMESGPRILIRSPKWTSENPTQDIPIMVFTTDQWDSLQREEFAVSAAPIGPRELGRNSKYVFALPARYNFSFLTGYEEVEDILSDDPLKTNENFQA